MYSTVTIVTLLALLKVSTTHAQVFSSENVTDSIMRVEEIAPGLTDFRLLWSLLAPVAKPIGSINIETDDNKLHYGYTDANGPATWAEDFPLCDDTRQSPINLNTASMQRISGNRLYWTTTYWVPPTSMTLRNSGHTVELSGKWDPLPAPELRGGPLEGGYTFWQMHFHWGSVNTRGSEHTVNGNSYPMELHAVHYKTSYGSPSNALKFPDGLAVVGFFYHISSKPGASISPLIPALSSVRLPGSSVPVKPIPLSSLLAHPTNYATYQGSLTTPSCYEVVTWLVSGTSFPVSQNQLAAFRSLLSDDGAMVDNFRPPQPLNGRSVFYVSK